VVAERISSNNPQIELERAHQTIEQQAKAITKLSEENRKLRNRLNWRDDLDRVPAKVMSQNHKAALNVAVKELQSKEPSPDGWIQLENTDSLAEDSGMATKTFQKCLTHNNKLGTIEKKIERVYEEGTNIVLATNTYVKETELTPYPRRYKAEEERNHGGTRLRCKCGSERIEKKVTYICTDCGECYDKKPEFQPPFDPNEPEDQFGFTDPEHKCEHEQESADDNDIHSEPEDQFGFTAQESEDVDPQDQFVPTENESRKPNLTPLSNNYPQDQLDPTAKDESNIPPMSSSAPLDHANIIEEWLNMRFGTPRVIKATEKRTQAEKYATMPESYTPDIQAFIRGEIEHIYGSRLLDPETSLTRVLCFDVDYHDPKQPDPQWLEQAQNWLVDFRRAGVTAVYWQRGQGGHFEIYFDQPVRPERARYWAYSICPDLEDIPECYPCQSVANKYLSWPMWQRRGYTVNSTPAHVMLPAPYEGGLQEIDPTDHQRLAELISLAVTPAALVEEFAKQADDLAEQKREQGRGNDQGGDIGIKPKPITQVGGKDLVPQVIADFNARYSWDDIAAMAGGWSDKGYFSAVWRGERTPSVKPDKDGRYVKDWGNYGSYPEKLDRYGAYCLIKGIDQKIDLAERCAELRREQSAVPVSVEPPIELFSVEQKTPPGASVCHMPYL